MNITRQPTDSPHHCTHKITLSAVGAVLLTVLLTLNACSPSAPAVSESNKATTPTPPKPAFIQATMLPDTEHNADTHEGHQVDYGIALFGTLKYPKDFTHFVYANPHAPKGGTIRLASFGRFDSLNQFIIRGNPADGLTRLYDTLLTSSADEPYSHYGLVAERVVVADLHADFYLRPQAHFSDGVPLTAEDVAFSFTLLVNQGSPLYKAYFHVVKDVQVLGKHHVRFTFKEPNREIAFILGDLPVLPKHYWQNKDFQATTLTPPIGSGPYVIGRVDAGKSITYQRNPNYWGKDLAVNSGHYNFATINIDYYRSEEVLAEAMRGGRIDFRQENSAKRWHTAYLAKPNQDNELRQMTVAQRNPAGMQGFVFNTRRPLFHNRLVRQALTYAFDFEFVNARFMYSTYTRTNSYFANSTLASSGTPSADEKALLMPYAEHLPKEVLTTEYQSPVSSGTGVFEFKQQALALLQQAGWTLKNGMLVDDKNAPFQFTIMLVSKSMERIVKPFVLNLKQIGIEANIQVIEVNQYLNRVQDFDFDMMVYVFPQSLSPGNEQRDYWSSTAAQTTGSRNVAGVHNPAIDALVDAVIAAQSKSALTTAVRALDRALLWNHYVIPHFHNRHHRVVYRSNNIQPPVAFPYYKFGIDTWWHATAH